MNFDTTDSDTIDPRSLLSRPLNSNAADVTIDDPDVGLGPIDFGDIDFGDVVFNDKNFAMTKPGLQELEATEFGRMEPGSMDFDDIDSGLADFGAVDFNEIAICPADSGTIELGTTSFGMFESGPTYGFTTAFDSMGPGTMADHRIDNGMMDNNVLENDTVDNTVTQHDLTDMSNLNPSTGGTDAAGDQQVRLSKQKSQPSAAEQRDGAIDLGYPRHHSLTTSPHPTLPGQICLGGSTAGKGVKLDGWREYQPKRSNTLATSAKITMDDWQDVRPFLEQLYVVENVKLKDVVKILWTKFGFVATYVALVLFTFRVTCIVLDSSPG